MGLDFCTYLVRTNEKMPDFLSVFYLILVCVYLPGLGVSEYEICFRGPIWMRLNDSGNLMRWAGAADVARRDKTEEACERRICPSLSRLCAAGPASSLFVVGCRRYPSCIYQVPGYSYLLLLGPHAARFFPFFRLVLPNKYLRIVCCCLLLLYFYYFVIFHVSFSAKEYAQGPHGGCIRSKKRGSLLYTSKYIK